MHGYSMKSQSHFQSQSTNSHAALDCSLLRSAEAFQQQSNCVRKLNIMTWVGTGNHKLFKRASFNKSNLFFVIYLIFCFISEQGDGVIALLFFFPLHFKDRYWVNWPIRQSPEYLSLRIALGLICYFWKSEMVPFCLGVLTAVKFGCWALDEDVTLAWKGLHLSIELALKPEPAST